MQTALRQWEYYGMTEVFSDLFERSRKGETFHRLMDVITSEANILLAFRSIKSNKGSKTPGTDKFTIGKYKGMSKESFIDLVRSKLDNYHPKKVRRKLIEKENGGLRPLGIPTMFDRLIQQMIKQVMEPIAEAKFFKHSYGFRPLRSSKHAKARCEHLINIANHHYAVDIDIKGFFDNVNHSLLLKQLWNMGFQDRRLLAIIMKVLKAPIDGEGVPSKGTPQGGILSPLLANIVLHDLDTWVSDQWESFEHTRHTYSDFRSRYNNLKRNTSLKRGFLVRYADDFKIFCTNHKDAQRWFNAVRLYLKDRLKLDISPEKSRVVNLRKNSTDFLGYKFKVVPKRNSWVATSYIKDSKKQRIKDALRKLIKGIHKNPGGPPISKYNSYVLGIHNYFKGATEIYHDLVRIHHDVSRLMHNRLRKMARYEVPRRPSLTYLTHYGGANRKVYIIENYVLYPVVGQKHSYDICFSQWVTPYTERGRKHIHKDLYPLVAAEIRNLMRSNLHGRSMEYMDNRISRYSMKRGLCEISGIFLTANEVHCHHYMPFENSKDDSFSNLRIIHKELHRAVHATDSVLIRNLIEPFQLNKGQIEKLNRFRRACNLELIR